MELRGFENRWLGFSNGREWSAGLDRMLRGRRAAGAEPWLCRRLFPLHKEADQMTITGFEDLYVAELQEARSFEAMLVEALAKMADAATEEQLKRAFREHREETREHQRSVEALIQRFQADPREHEDQSMQVLVSQSEKMAGLVEAGPLRDAALIASAQRIEHYEIAVYGTLATYAELLGLDEDCEILTGILGEEKDTDDLLSDIAVGMVNPAGVEKEAGR
jgi:ferritin-like metal-binding protein YciE